jgi:TRAP-type C4-dicarboxylate transport system permease small subunit
VRALLLTGEHWLNRIVVALSCLGLVVAAVTGFIQVVSRFILHLPTAWSEPVIQLSLIWMVYLGLAAGARSGGLIAVSFLYERTRGPFRQVMRLAIALSVLALFGVLIWFGWTMVYLVRNQTVAGLGISASWAYAAIPLGAGFAALAVIAHYFAPPARDVEEVI